MLIIFTGPQSSLSCDSEVFDVDISEFMNFFLFCWILGRGVKHRTVQDAHTLHKPDYKFNASMNDKMCTYWKDIHNNPVLPY